MNFVNPFVNLDRVVPGLERLTEKKHVDDKRLESAVQIVAQFRMEGFDLPAIKSILSREKYSPQEIKAAILEANARGYLDLKSVSPPSRPD